MSNKFYIPKLAVFGVGLIGGSLAIALKNAGAVGQVIGVGRSLENLNKALALGVIDEVQSDPLTATKDADLIVLATPVNTVIRMLEKIEPALDYRKIVTDVGSVKGEIAQRAKSILGDKISQFIPGHPIAGKEKSGVTAAAGNLFENHKVVLTPLSSSDRHAYAQVERMWLTVGALVTEMDVLSHDRVLSITSHLPHLLSYTMMNFLSNSQEKDKCYEMAAGGFYDFTRTASSDPEMWRDISLMNRQQLLRHLGEFQSELSGIAELIESGDEQAIETLFASAKKARSLVSDRRSSD
ncbi:MAG: prephenate dehydrogenase/arogenate dehydrogenase family protein [Gammaproteobacteria bacterium]|nr:prephenate dehydrogenase/arogenate dehydrogenase family protein [Gammaproteobacteria bacterium]